MVSFIQHIETLEAKVKPEGTPTESRGELRTRGKFTGKWFAEGKGKRGDLEYPDRMPALKAERVLARS